MRNVASNTATGILAAVFLTTGANETASRSQAFSARATTSPPKTVCICTTRIGLELQDVTLVGFSTGGGEVARYIGRHGTSRVKKAVLISAVTPLMLKTSDNPAGTPIEVYDEIRRGSLENRSQQYLDIASGPFFGFNRPGATVSHRD